MSEDVLRARMQLLAWAPAACATDPVCRSILEQLPIQDLAAVAETARQLAGGAAVAALYRAWIDRNDGRSPHVFLAWYNLGAELSALGDAASAERCWQATLRLKPDFHPAAINLGLAAERRGGNDEALAIWRGALQPDDARLALLNSMGRLEEKLGRADDAEATLRRSLLVKPHQSDVLQHWIRIRQRQCAWPLLGDGIPGLAEADLVGAAAPVSCLALTDDVSTQAAVVERSLAARPEWQRSIGPLALAEGYRHPRLRIGYLSSDFCRHPTTFLLTELIERHDRARFEIYAYCSSPDDGSDERRRIIGAFDHVRFIGHLDDAMAARVVRADEIDVLIDLNGATKGLRLGLLRAKPAPVQMTWLGFVGPLPIPEIDYMLCDDYVVPADRAAEYRPRPLPIAGCFQPTDSRLAVAPPETRAAAGLPEDRFVYCAFSNPYKITPEMFSAWMSILAETDKSVLWLLGESETARRNLGRAAERLGIDPARLVFAPRLAPEVYRARLALADVFLDTFPYNGGATASDALRMGVPVVTRSGRSMASRMAGSLLSAVGLDDLIATDRDGYVMAAVFLAKDTGTYRAVRDQLEQGAWAAALGDTAVFANRLEAALIKAINKLNYIKKSEVAAA